MVSRNIMVQGTASYSGKSFLTMALCRIFSKKGYRVTPFKSQNTALNSYVTADGYEISRAQALQAFAAGEEPIREMNPILVKPKGEHRAQIVVNGRPLKDIEAYDYYREFALKEGIPIIKDAFKILNKNYDIAVMEGAGSPAEINLYDQDISNMKVAEIADSSVILIADIDRGGVFANIYGTVGLLKQEDKSRIRGIVINKFRGDIEILKPGIKKIEELTGIPVIGVIPYIQGLNIPDEDSMGIPRIGTRGKDIDISVIKLPHISNFTDFDPLIYEEGVSVRFISSPSELGQPDALIVPGTKNTINDLKWLKEQGFLKVTERLLGKIPIMGICGGYQMLGNKIKDPEGIEDTTGIYEGMGLLNIETVFESYEKTTVKTEAEGKSSLGEEDIQIEGYEIHMGKTVLGENVKPLFIFDGKSDGAFDKNKKVFGTYFHGVFDSPDFRSQFLGLIDKKRSWNKSKNIRELWDQSIEKAARVLEESLDIGKIEEIMDLRGDNS